MYIKKSSENTKKNAHKITLFRNYSKSLIQFFFDQFWRQNSNDIFVVIFKHCEKFFKDIFFYFLNTFYMQILNTETDVICFSISLNMHEHFLLPIF